MNTPPLNDDHERRFGGLERLYGDGSRLALHRSHVAVIGVGGIGSWAAEALARSGIGNLTLIDLDHVAVSNVNRQIHALNSTLGQAKVQALANRIHDINTACKVHVIDEFLSEENLEQTIPADTFDFVIDACDDARAKAGLIAHARYNKIPFIVCGAAGGKEDPLKLRVDDIGRTTHDALMSRVRDRLRRYHNMRPHRNGKFGVTCIFLDEPSKRNAACTTGKLSCAGYGSVVTITATMGFTAASLCLKRIIALHKEKINA
ncbi:MAG: tRNA threonylcarbamoyladenosine dehydratase [Gallionella sp.]